MFFSYNKDGTGFIDKREFEAICQKEDVFLDGRMFMVIDEDGSGSITLEELLNVLIPNAPKKMVRQMVRYCEGCCRFLKSAFRKARR